MASLPSVAIAGATGHLGCKIAAAFLDQRFRPHFNKIVLLMRKPANDLPKLLGVQDASGVTVRIYDENSIEESLAEIDIVVCTIGSKGDAFRQKLVRAMANTNVRLYFPSEFGINRANVDFPHPEWAHKKAHYELARSHVPKARICRVYTGLLLEDSIGPWFGFDAKNAKYETIGSPDTPITFTSLSDVGKVVAQLSLLPTDKVPETVRIAGDTKSPAQVAKLMEKAGSPPIQITSLDLPAFKGKTLEEVSDDPAPSLRFLMGEGKLNNGDPQGNENENRLVNPDESNWKWKTLEDHARETGGKPWSDFP